LTQAVFSVTIRQNLAKVGVPIMSRFKYQGTDVYVKIPAPPQPNLFDTAKVINAGITKTGKGKKATSVQITGLQDLVMLDGVRDAINVLINEKILEINAQVREIFIVEGCAQKTRPANFSGVDGEATASMQLKKRSEASLLTPQQIAILKRAGIPLSVITDVRELFIINPDMADDQNILAAAHAALHDAPGVPRGFIMKQEGSQRTVVTDSSILALFQKPKPVVDKLLNMVCSIIPGNRKYEGSFGKACLRAWHLLNPPPPMGKINNRLNHQSPRNGE
jgi:hypothetical protein